MHELKSKLDRVSATHQNITMAAAQNGAMRWGYSGKLESPIDSHAPDLRLRANMCEQRSGMHKNKKYFQECSRPLKGISRM